MAINGVVFTPKDVLLGLAEEATFGTAIADNAAFIQYPEFDSVTVDYGLTQEMGVRNRSRRMIDDDDVHVSQTGGIRTITISGLRLRNKDAAELLYAVCQDVIEGETPFLKTFNIDWTTQPNFAADAGFFCTIGLDTFIDGYHEKFTSCVGKNIKLSYEGAPGGDGNWKADIVFISGFAADTTATFSGTWTVNTQTLIDGHKAATKSIAGSDVVLYKLDVEIENNAERIGNDSDGNCEGYAIGVGGNGMEIKANATVKYDANVQALKAAYLAGTATALIYTVTTYLDIQIGAAIITSFADEGLEQGAAINIELTGVYKSGSLITIAVTDGTDKSWPAS